MLSDGLSTLPVAVSRPFSGSFTVPITLLPMRFAARRRRRLTAVRTNSVEDVQVRLDRLNLERQELRTRNVVDDVLERNRLAIVAAQWELSHALIERYLAVPHRDAA